MKYFLLIFLMATACTQNFLSYVKQTQPLPLIDGEQILCESGLIFPATNKKTLKTNNNQYSNVELLPNNQKPFVIIQNTKEIPKNSKFIIKVNVKNYLIAIPYYSSPKIIYNMDDSIPNQGEFHFVAADESGIIRIRIYDQEGVVFKEEVWNIEVQP